MILFDPAHVPFSRRERFLTLSMMDGALMLRSVRGGDLRPSLGRLARVGFERDGAEVAVTLSHNGTVLVARGGSDLISFQIGDGERLHVSGKAPFGHELGLSVVLHLEGSRYDYAYRTPQGEDCLVAAYEDVRLFPRVETGTLHVSGSWRRDRADHVTCRLGGTGRWLSATIDLVTGPQPRNLSPTVDLGRMIDDDRAYAARFSPPRPGGEAAHRLATYLLWANSVPAEGALSRPAVYMSKNHMINIWSWDNAFSALGLAAADPDLAFDQFAAIYDRQAPSGMLPDFVHDAGASYAFTKPPVHGWAIGLIGEMVPGWLTPDRSAYLGDHLERQVEWWLRETRRTIGDLPSYPHGNDSGWDNASFFDKGGPVMSPDLPTFLILCCDMLERLQPSRAAHWHKTGTALLNILLGRLSDGTTFGTRRLSDRDTLDLGQSLIRFMPLLLGNRLPRKLAASLITQLPDHLTVWGLATEAPASPFYEPDGYWRGPIWAPTTALVWDGLNRQGEHALARDVAERFCRLCETSGMAENFDALTGAPLRDRAFAWTSAVYLLFSGALA